MLNYVILTEPRICAWFYYTKGLPQAFGLRQPKLFT